MYIRLTSRCNMSCPHCAFAATNKGTNMDRYTFIKALDLAVDLDEYVMLGGGEPTCHPEFLAMLDKALEYRHAGRLEQLAMVVNGKLAGKTRQILDRVDDGALLYVELSQDEYHDPIRADIVQSFKMMSRRTWEYGAGVGIRTVREIVPVGRAADPARGLPINPQLSCACEDLCVDMDGLVYSCGCRHHLLGSVYEDSSVFSGYDREQAHTGGGLPARNDVRSIHAALAA